MQFVSPECEHCTAAKRRAKQNPRFPPPHPTHTHTHTHTQTHTHTHTHSCTAAQRSVSARAEASCSVDCTHSSAHTRARGRTRNTHAYAHRTRKHSGDLQYGPHELVRVVSGRIVVSERRDSAHLRTKRRRRRRLAMLPDPLRASA
jgi:hypothetical protein